MNEQEVDDKKKFDDLLFNVRVSIRYHRRRRDFFKRWHARANAIIIILGSASVFSLLNEWGKLLGSLPGLIVTIVATFDLVFSTCSKISTHGNIVRRLLSIEEEIVSYTTSNNELYNKLFKEWQAIKRDEPDTLRTLEGICYNQVVRSKDYPENEQISIKWYQRLLADFIDIAEHKLKKETKC